ncbi:MAG: methylmalonyl-CoA mutase subunit beta [Flavobacteriaceae bacterium]|nr:methylmalonyl-CoA mutase subunit beta [Flavobacteriaceae bacterium]
MTKSLFNDFNPVSAKAWKQKIQLDLKGADYNDTLIWNSLEGIDVKPFYNSEDLESISHYIDTPKTWNICESIYVKNNVQANKEAQYKLSKGSESLKFIIPNKEFSIQAILKDIDTSSTPIYLDLEFLDAEFAKQITDTQISINTDIIGNLVKTGNWYVNLDDDHKHLEKIIKHTNTFSVNASIYQNAGANMVQQLAYALAHTNEYLNHINNTESLRVFFETSNNQPLNVNFKVSIGTNYFFEIAKLRALRLLFNELIEEYSFNAECQITVTPSKRNKTLYDYNTNMLRTTTECMSAILGGANTINNLAYDAIYHKENEFASRIARNQLLVLKHESYFSEVTNASDGAYYIESLTNQLAEKALDLFKNLEAKGGFISQLFDGTIQRKIKENAQKEQDLFDHKEEILLGTNKHPNPNDKMQHELELYPFVKTNIRKTLIEPIIEKRLSETIEKERLENEKNQ